MRDFLGEILYRFYVAENLSSKGSAPHQNSLLMRCCFQPNLIGSSRKYNMPYSLIPTQSLFAWFFGKASTTYWISRSPACREFHDAINANCIPRAVAWFNKFVCTPSWKNKSVPFSMTLLPWLTPLVAFLCVPKLFSVLLILDSDLKYLKESVKRLVVQNKSK